jgi:hypothetical protein
MTREEAIEELERLLSHWDDLEKGKRRFRWYSKAALDVALSALRPVTREQEEKVFPGCDGCNDGRCTSCKLFGWHQDACKRCENQSNYQPLNFCPHCGKPLRDGAMQMVMEKLEEVTSE